MSRKMINLSTKIINKATAAVMAGFLLLSFLAGCSGQQQTLELSGTVEALQVDVNAETSGKVIHLGKDEGDTVNQGDVLALIDSGMQELAVKQQEALVKLKQARLDEVEAGTRPEEIEKSEASVKSAESAAKNARTGVDTAKTGYDYWVEKYNQVKSLHSSGSATDNDLLDAKYKVDTAKQQLAVAEKQLKSSEAQLEAAKAQLTLLQKGATTQAVTAAQADLEQVQVLLEQARLTLTRCRITAPVGGIYKMRSIEIGDMVNIGTGVATLLIPDELWVTVYLPQKYLQNLSLNLELEVKVNGLQEDGKGKVTYIASEAEFTPKNTETNEAKENTVFKVKVKILDPIDRLKTGMTADVLIPLSGSR